MDMCTSELLWMEERSRGAPRVGWLTVCFRRQRRPLHLGQRRDLRHHHGGQRAHPPCPVPRVPYVGQTHGSVHGQPRVLEQVLFQGLQHARRLSLASYDTFPHTRSRRLSLASYDAFPGIRSLNPIGRRDGGTERGCVALRPSWCLPRDGYQEGGSLLCGRSAFLLAIVPSVLRPG